MVFVVDERSLHMAFSTVEYVTTRRGGPIRGRFDTRRGRTSSSEPRCRFGTSSSETTSHSDTGFGLITRRASPCVDWRATQRALTYTEVTLLRLAESIAPLIARPLQILEAGSERPLSLLMRDIDFFKSINDRFGHDAGDK